MTRLTAQQIDNLPEWMTIPDYPSYEVNCRAGLLRNAKTMRVLKSNPNNKGYPQVGLCKDGKARTKTVHRLVAEVAYHHYGISTNGFDVCHLDETRTNSCIDNLVLGSTKENMGMPKAKQRNSESKKGEKNHWFGKHLSEKHRMKLAEAQSKRVGAYKNGELIMVFQSTQEAGRNGFNQCNVSACCTGKVRTHRGYEWKYL